MANNIFDRLNELHHKTVGLIKNFETQDPKDIRLSYLKLISSQVASSLLSLRIVYKYNQTYFDDFSNFFNGDKGLIDNYIHVFKQSNIEAILDTLLFQGELVFRILHGKMQNIDPSQTRNVNKIIADLYDDTENSWKKDEAKIMVLFWTIRNTIHTGGIYYKNSTGNNIIYKGYEYKFEFLKSFKFLEDKHIIDLISDFLDSIKILFSSPKIQALGMIEHPSFYALK